MAKDDLSVFAGQLRPVPVAARKLLCVIARQAYHGVLRTKDHGVATMPEVHEACGLDVDAMYEALQILRNSQLIRLEGEYPFEEIRFDGGATVMEAILKRCEASKIAVEDVVAELRFDRLQ